MSYSDKDLFFNSLLLFSEADMKTLTESTVAIAGIGGIGCILTEMLTRHGVGNLRVADIDNYDRNNLNRQIFATYDTLGINKAEAAAQRIRQINRDCNVTVFADGVRLHTVDDFCRKADVILAQTDTESSKILLHRTAKLMGIPVICGSRASLDESRWLVKAKVWNYRKHPDTPCYAETNHPEMAKIPTAELTPELLKAYDEKIKQKKMAAFRNSAETRPDLFPSISQDNLAARLREADNYSNRHVCSVIANQGGILAATQTLRVLLGGPDDDLVVKLW